MKTIEYKYDEETLKQLDLLRVVRPPGPWQDEPDKVQWPDPATGLPCLARRSPHMGFWCGYVGVDDQHPLHGKYYDKVDVNVHGGLTFADACRVGGDPAFSICHVPEPWEPDDVWWFGFDCGHFMDRNPYYPKGAEDLMPLLPGEYRSLDYVKAECTKLAAQLHAMR